MRRRKQKLVSETVGGETYEFYPMGTNIVRAPAVCGGRPTFKYTRIEVTFILNLIANGESIDSLVADYDGRISREAILEAIQLVTKNFSQSFPQAEPA